MNIQIPDDVCATIDVHVDTPEQYTAITSQFPDVEWEHRRIMWSDREGDFPVVVGERWPRITIYPNGEWYEQ